MDDRTTKILNVIKDLPAKTLTTTMRNPRSSSERAFVGARLFDYIVAAGAFPSKMGGGMLANGYFTIAAEDGARVAIALAEVWPNITGKEVLLAYQQDGEFIRNGIRLVITGDHLGGRSLGGIVSIELHRIEPAKPTEPREPNRVALRGLLNRPGFIDAVGLRAHKAVNVTTVAATGHGGQPIAPRRYTGVRLYDLLDSAGIRLNPKVNEDFLGKVIVVTSADGHVVVIAGGEIEPRFMNGDVIIATQHNGAPLASTEGNLRLMVPFDRKPGRWAKDLVSIDLREG
ncbi:MAG: hypothetical protein EXR67_05805 [Dehalococcoidia bacterium]|nr:hypothetical protein [Dehalococcoidia bacterium]